MRATSSKQLVAALIGILAIPASVQVGKLAYTESAQLHLLRPAAPKAPQAVVVKPDPRTVRLTRFLSRLHCPVLQYAQDFIAAADENHLDWRLLPSISVIESGGGKAYRNNNIFGWDNGNQPFLSVQRGIREVAYHLGRSPLYRNRDVVGKLRVYNPDQEYVSDVVAVMNRIDPSPRLDLDSQDD